MHDQHAWATLNGRGFVRGTGEHEEGSPAADLHAAMTLCGGPDLHAQGIGRLLQINKNKHHLVIGERLGMCVNGGRGAHATDMQTYKLVHAPIGVWASIYGMAETTTKTSTYAQYETHTFSILGSSPSPATPPAAPERGGASTV